MGGWYQKERFIELLEEAEQTLFDHGFDEQSDAVEQALVLLKKQPCEPPDQP